MCRDITDKQRRLAEITEMIHTASLVHDDVVDDCDTRRGTVLFHTIQFSTGQSSQLLTLPQQTFLQAYDATAL